jgi:preprotein translocase subunit SecD
MVSGDQLTDASQSFDQDGRPDINIKFNTAGARRFGRATQENVNKPFAIILDDKVLSAPNINEPILGGNAQIAGSFTVQSAHDLAVSLASGKLPVKLNVIEERTVSAELGQDSIHKGAIASIVSVLCVIVFMLVTYGRFGVYADIALVVNAFLILGIMARKSGVGEGCSMRSRPDTARHSGRFSTPTSLTSSRPASWPISVQGRCAALPSYC